MGVACLAWARTIALFAAELPTILCPRLPASLLTCDSSVDVLSLSPAHAFTGWVSMLRCTFAAPVETINPTTTLETLDCLQQVGDALIAINYVGVQGIPFADIMQRMKQSLREGPMVLRFRTMEERYRLLRMKVRLWCVLLDRFVCVCMCVFGWASYWEMNQVVRVCVLCLSIHQISSNRAIRSCHANQSELARIYYSL